jgi:hypothetical protein
MRNILGVLISIILILSGLLILLDNEDTTRESVIEENGKTIIIHKKIGIKRIKEDIDPEYKKNHNLDYY